MCNFNNDCDGFSRDTKDRTPTTQAKTCFKTKINLNSGTKDASGSSFYVKKKIYDDLINDIPNQIQSNYYYISDKRDKSNQSSNLEITSKNKDNNNYNSFPDIIGFKEPN